MIHHHRRRAGVGGIHYEVMLNRRVSNASGLVLERVRVIQGASGSNFERVRVYFERVRGSLQTLPRRLSLPALRVIPPDEGVHTSWILVDLRDGEYVLQRSQDLMRQIYPDIGSNCKRWSVPGRSRLRCSVSWPENGPHLQTYHYMSIVADSYSCMILVLCNLRRSLFFIALRLHLRIL